MVGQQANLPCPAIGPLGWQGKPQRVDGLGSPSCSAKFIVGWQVGPPSLARFAIRTYSHSKQLCTVKCLSYYFGVSYSDMQKK